MTRETRRGDGDLFVWWAGGEKKSHSATRIEPGPSYQRHLRSDVRHFVFSTALAWARGVYRLSWGTDIEDETCVYIVSGSSFRDGITSASIAMGEREGKSSETE